MVGKRFAYRRGLFYQRLMVAALASVVVGLLLLLQPIDVPYAALAVTIPLLYGFIYGFSPLLTSHGVEDGCLWLRQGLYFRATVPLKEIENVAEFDGAEAPLGAGWSRSLGAVYVTSSRMGRVEIRLRIPHRFSFLLGRRSRRVIVTVEDPAGFKECLAMGRG